MVKLIVFDLDGVLVDARELHYQALNMALKDIDDSFVIERDEHLSTYDGLSTTKKLQMLSERKGLPEKFHHTVWKTKQQKTIEIIDSFIKGKKYSVVISSVAHKEFHDMKLNEWKSLVEENGILFDLKGLIPRELNPLRI